MEQVLRVVYSENATKAKSLLNKAIRLESQVANNDAHYRKRLNSSPSPQSPTTSPPHPPPTTPIVSDHKSLPLQKAQLFHFTTHDVHSNICLSGDHLQSDYLIIGFTSSEGFMLKFYKCHLCLNAPHPPPPYRAAQVKLLKEKYQKHLCQSIRYEYNTLQTSICLYDFFVLFARLIKTWCSEATQQPSRVLFVQHQMTTEVISGHFSYAADPPLYYRDITAPTMNKHLAPATRKNSPWLRVDGHLPGLIAPEEGRRIFLFSVLSRYD